MSHLRPEVSRRRSRASCRKGLHAYGPMQQIGGGISRRVCNSCSAVSIDISGAYEMGTPSAGGFTRRTATSR